MANTGTIQPGSTSILNTLKAFTGTLVPASLVLFAHQRTLTPLYGSYPTNYLLDAITSVAVLASTIFPFRMNESKRWLYGALALSLAPNGTYWVAVWTSRKRWPVFGPAVTHAVVLAPLVFIFITILPESSIGTNPDVRQPLQYRLLRAGANYFILTSLARKVWPGFSYLSSISESQIYLTLAAIAFGLFILGLDFSLRTAVTSKPKKRTKEQASKYSLSSTQIKTTLLVAFAALWWTLHPLLANPVLPHPLEEIYTHPTGKAQILSAVRSATGLIIVGETLPPPDGGDDPMHSARYLRADHSILGGYWVRSKVQMLDDEAPVLDSFGMPLGDTFYSTFVLQEAARLVNSTEVGRTGAWKSALTIGLGTGLSTSAFIQHGLSTTVVEIDPAVYDAARTWFGLPDPGPDNVFLEDARAWSERRLHQVEAGLENRLYDIVVHDCFSGGGVPAHIFTAEFWSGLRQLMQSEGILVVNFAGIVKSESTKLVVHTLEHSFKQCRAFHDLMDDLTEDQYNTEFVNIVFFCTNSAAPLTFRKPKRSDYLGSPIRRFVFQSLATREVNLDAVRVEDPAEYILTDKKNPLGELQRKQGLHHWELMRKVLPDLHWETY